MLWLAGLQQRQKAICDHLPGCLVVLSLSLPGPLSTRSTFTLRSYVSINRDSSAAGGAAAAWPWGPRTAAAIAQFHRLGRPSDQGPICHQDWRSWCISGACSNATGSSAPECLASLLAALTQPRIFALPARSSNNKSTGQR